MNLNTRAQRRRSAPWAVAVNPIMTRILSLLCLMALVTPVAANPAYNPDVTQATIDATICQPHWTATVRPSFWASQKIKLEMLKARGETWAAAPFVVLDHIVPLCLGGSPTDSSNLQLEPREESYRKDRVEVVASQCVCNRQVTLEEARQDLATDWRVAYHKYAKMTCRRMPSLSLATMQSAPPAAAATVDSASEPFTCAGQHKYCKEMQSCAEACFYFTQCGEARLDRDNDSIPCENVCHSPCK